MTDDVTLIGQRKLPSNRDRGHRKRLGDRTQISRQPSIQSKSPIEDLETASKQMVPTTIWVSTHPAKQLRDLDASAFSEIEHQNPNQVFDQTAGCAGNPNSSAVQRHQHLSNRFYRSKQTDEPNRVNMYSVSIDERGSEAPRQGHQYTRGGMNYRDNYRHYNSRTQIGPSREDDAVPRDQVMHPSTTLRPREYNTGPSNSSQAGRGRGYSRYSRGVSSRGSRQPRKIDLSSNSGYRFTRPYNNQRNHRANPLQSASFASMPGRGAPQNGRSLIQSPNMRSTSPAPPQRDPAHESWSYWDEGHSPAPQASYPRSEEANQIQENVAPEAKGDVSDARHESQNAVSYPQSHRKLSSSSKAPALDAVATTIGSGNNPPLEVPKVNKSPNQPRPAEIEDLSQFPPSAELLEQLPQMGRQTGTSPNHDMAMGTDVLQLAIGVHEREQSPAMEAVAENNTKNHQEFSYPTKSRRRGESKWPSRNALKTSNRNDVQDPEDKASALLSLAGADAGSGDVVENNAEHESFLDNQLADWDGSWAPAPVEWDSRPAFKDRKFMDTMESWIRLVQKQHFERIDISDAAFRDGSAPVQEDGMLGLPLEHPRSLLDPEDEFTAAHIMQTAQMSALERSNRVLRREKEKKQRQKVLRASLMEHAANYVPPPNPYAPKANIYLRPAQLSDIAQIRDIYQYYVETSVYVSELTSVTTAQMQNRWEDVCESKLPWLVAVDRKMNKRRSGAREQILGFGFADEYNSVHSSYRYTVELELYVRPECRQLGIGRCLMDKLMGLLDPIYVEREGYDFVCEGGEYGPGGARVIGKVLCMIGYDGHDRTQLEWLKKWLGQWDFSQAGDLQGIGWKFDRPVNVACFQMTTGSRIEPRRGM